MTNFHSMDVLQKHIRKFNESREYRNLAISEVISRTPQSFPGFLSALNPAQLLSHVVIAPLPCHGADGTCCAVGAGRAAARGRQEPERHRRSAFPTQMQSRAPSAREVCSLVRFNIKM